jgi:hypothetical protein
LPVLFKHFYFKQHDFETLTIFAIIKVGIDPDSTDICWDYTFFLVAFWLVTNSQAQLVFWSIIPKNIL